MILSELNNLILEVVRSNYLVKEAFIGDVYAINSKENKFGCFVATPMSARKSNSNTITYTYVLYYIDRLTKDESNIDLVQSDAVSVLTGLVDWLQNQSVELDLEYNYTLFRHQFGDWCAGAYLNIGFIVPDLTCGEEDFIQQISGTIQPLLVTANGTYTPDPGDGFGPVYVNVASGGGGVTPEWVDREIDYKLQGYATQSWVSSKYYATQTWVLNKNYITSSALSSYATESWVLDKEYITSSALSGYATESWVSSKEFATQAWVLSQGYITSETIPTDIATQSWVSSNFLSSAALSGYATESWVLAQGYITSETIPTDIATQSWVLSQNYITSSALSGYATESWVLSQNYYTPGSSETVLCTIQPTDMDPIVSTGLIIGQYQEGDFVEGVELGNGHAGLIKHYYNGGEDYYYEFLTESNLSLYLDEYSFATESWVSSNFLSTTALTGYATQSWVSNQISDVQLWVLNQAYITSEALTGYATESWVSSQQFATTSYVGSQISDVQSWTTSVLSSFATKSWVQSQGYATQSWVLSQNYITSAALTGYATESWVSSQQFATTSYVGSQISDVQSWVTSQNFATVTYVGSQISDVQSWTTSVLSSYATQSWATSEFFEESKIWTGTQSAWNSLPAEQQVQYTIALIIEE